MFQEPRHAWRCANLASQRLHRLRFGIVTEDATWAFQRMDGSSDASRVSRRAPLPFAMVSPARRPIARDVGDETRRRETAAPAFNYRTECICIRPSRCHSPAAGGFSVLSSPALTSPCSPSDLSSAADDVDQRAKRRLVLRSPRRAGGVPDDYPFANSAFCDRGHCRVMEKGANHRLDRSPQVIAPASV